MLLHFCLLWAGRLGLSASDPPVKTVQQNTDAALPCPPPAADGDVMWSRLRNGDKVCLVRIRNGDKERADKRFDIQADHTLVISKVHSSDAAMYFCNEKKTYLNVSTDPSVEASKAQPEGGGGTENQPPPSDLWKIPLGVVIGATAVLLAMLPLRSCPRRGAGICSHRVDKAVTEGVYEEIRDGAVQLGGGSDVDGSWSSITEAPTSNSDGGCRDECVYSLAQHPHTGSNA